mmetsp:Transcript_13722/g.20722  ORF Transcript_13722/g.20722 Transcript_13722/m.20722 type:complete len:144 (+) Transcript_13722:359-790(+)
MHSPSQSQSSTLPQKNNEALKIGGMLFCDVVDGKVIQVLEGDKMTVMGLIQKIKFDKRHKNMEIIRQEVVKERQYSQWGMQFAQSDQDWNVVMDIIRLQQARKGLVKARGFGSFDDLTDIPSQGITRSTFGGLSSMKTAFNKK